MDDSRKLIPGDLYRHFKNKLYQIITVASHSETGESYVVYQALYGDFKTYIRPYDMFMSEVDHEKYPEVTQHYRFERVSRDNSGNMDSTVSQAYQNTADKEADLETTQTEETVPSEDEVNPYLMGFFDCDTCAARIEYLNGIKKHLNDRLVNDIAASLDLTIEEGALDGRIEQLINCLQTMAHFECSRLR